LATEDVELWTVDDLSTGISPDQWTVPKVIPDGQGNWGKKYRIGPRAVLHFVQADFLALALGELGRSSRIAPALPHFDEIYHLASVVGGRNVIDNDPLAVGIDLAIDSAFFLWAGKLAKPERILYASSSAAYPTFLQGTDGNVSLREDMIEFADTVGMPDYSYGWSKLSGEFLSGIAVRKYGLSVGIVRPFSGYGEDQEPVYPFPAIALRVAARQSPVTVWGSGKQSRDFVHIDDAVEACVRACRRISDASAVNIGTGTPTSFIELAKRMIQIEGYDADVVGKVDAPVGVAARYCDPSRMRAVLEWEPTISLDDGIRRALETAKARLASGVKPD
jgi:nucleoside-diphosphate-sugar epimerase